MSVDAVNEFIALLGKYGSACEACGECGADPDYRPSTMAKYQKVIDETFPALVDMYEAAVENGGAELQEIAVDLYNLLDLTMPSSAIKDATLARVRGDLRKVGVEVER